MKQLQQIKARVKRGVKWLEKEKPNWVKKIITTKLLMEDPKTCMCGQIYGNYYDSPFEFNDRLSVFQ